MVRTSPHVLIRSGGPVFKKKALRDFYFSKLIKIKSRSLLDVFVIDKYERHKASKFKKKILMSTLIFFFSGKLATLVFLATS